MSFTLITNAYSETTPERVAEYRTCLDNNLALEYLIERVVVVLEDADSYLTVHPRLVQMRLGHRGTFYEYFVLANQIAPAGSRVILSNADIYFDRTLALAEHLFDREPRTLVCLSRWDRQADGTEQLMDIGDSHDAWIFQTPFMLEGATFTLGVPGCDGRIAWLAERAGIPLVNPAKSVRAHHCHQSGRRNYTEYERVRGAYHWVMASTIEG